MIKMLLFTVVGMLGLVAILGVPLVFGIAVCYIINLIGIRKEEREKKQEKKEFPFMEFFKEIIEENDADDIFFDITLPSLVFILISMVIGAIIMS